MTMKYPEITIAIPTRNRCVYLMDAVRSALSQDFTEIEVIVSDNASTDDTRVSLSGVNDPRLVSFRHEKLLSMHENWNFCLAKARGSLFLLLSDDDILLPGAVAALKSAFASREVRMAYGPALLFENGGRVCGSTLKGPEVEAGSAFIRESLRGKRQPLPCATMHYTADAAAMGGYPEIGNATDLALRLALSLPGKVYCHPSPVAKYRFHPGSLTSNSGETIRSFRLFRDWVSVPMSPLAEWSELAVKFCAEALIARAFSSALRGDAAAAREFFSAAKEFSGLSWYHHVLFRLCSLPPIRLFASLRRSVRRMASVRCERSDI